VVSKGFVEHRWIPHWWGGGGGGESPSKTHHELGRNFQIKTGIIPLLTTIEGRKSDEQVKGARRGKLEENVIPGDCKIGRTSFEHFSYEQKGHPKTTEKRRSLGGKKKKKYCVPLKGVLSTGQ